MNNTGSILAHDVNLNKVSEIKKGSKRLGLNIIIPSQNDSTVLSEDLIESADVVLADVPCSGFGVIRKKPEIRYKEQDSLTCLPEIQLKILTCLSQYVKPGGTLLYSTCTILKNENEDVINRFLENNNNYKLDAFTLPKFGDVNNGMITLWPHVHETDGFFICKLRRDK